MPDEDLFQRVDYSLRLGSTGELRQLNVSRVVVYGNQIVFPFIFTGIHPHFLKRVVWEFARN